MEDFYEGMSGVEIEVEIIGLESLAGITNQKINVVSPDGTRSEYIPVVDTDAKVFKYLHSEPLKAGEYLCQPYFKQGDFSGPWGTYSFTVSRRKT